MKRFSGVFLTVLYSLNFIAVPQLTAQDLQEKVYAFFPARIPGYATDPPVATTEDDGVKTYTNVSIMYYAPDGSRLVEIKLKDFNLNPKNYEEEYEQVKKSEGSYAPSAGRPFTYETFTAFERRKENTSAWILFLGDHVILEVSYQGQDDAFKTVQEITRQLNIKAMKQAFLVLRSKGRTN
jgi:hypothetical protein